MNKSESRIKVFLVDDEPLALRRLARLLEATRRVEIVGRATDPEDALDEINEKHPELLFLDIQMPVLNGFEMLARLSVQPIVIFTTAFDQYALRAFEVNSIDYLLKPIESEQLVRALNKAERLRGSAPPELNKVIGELKSALQTAQTRFPARIASRLGERTEFVELALVTHFLAENKMIYAVTPTKKYVIDYSINELEQRLDPKVFVRIHRSVLLNANYVQEINQWFAGGVLVRLKDGKQTELTVARDRVRMLKERLSI